MPYEGVSAPLKIIFFSGDEVYCYREVPIKYNGRNFLLLYMLLDDYVKWRYGITDKMLDFKIDSQGLYKAVFPKHLIHHISSNPEHPLAVAYVNFDGTEVIDDLISDLKNQIQRKDDAISSQLGQIRTLQEETKTLAEQVRMLKRGQLEVD